MNILPLAYILVGDQHYYVNYRKPNAHFTVRKVFLINSKAGNKITKMINKRRYWQTTVSFPNDVILACDETERIVFLKKVGKGV